MKASKMSDLMFLQGVYEHMSPQQLIKTVSDISAILEKLEHSLALHNCAVLFFSQMYWLFLYAFKCIFC